LGSQGKRKQREREKQKNFAKTKQARTEAASQGPAPARIIRIDLGTPEQLIVAGPLIAASWSVPAPLATALHGAGRPVPPAVPGMLLIDTGASSTCISESAAARLGLRPIRIAQTLGSGGSHPSNMYEAHLQILIEDPKRGVLSNLDIEFQAVGVPQLEQQLPGLTFNGQPTELVSLLGRDFLRNTTMTYRGDGSFEIVLKKELWRIKPGL
jgi:predicted aspartyl protease